LGEGGTWDLLQADESLRTASNKLVELMKADSQLCLPHVSSKSHTEKESRWQKASITTNREISTKEKRKKILYV